ncbi:hypothetical protein CH75_17410 [Dyella jiangningensis]|uniref:hypothetical protein n=1 Tax=Dyella jiangningensis TaxID=1379159 RepID=UPI000456564D|nr:hypothetical protein [Dyella jiangningensis]AHX16412.1 hypothetical protein CH75_17410 [Dyella jiangningensis]MDG2537799.1 hypothetical protein [Dyella jiangningensis]
MRTPALLLAASLGLVLTSHAVASDRPDPGKLTTRCLDAAAKKFDVKNDYIQLQPIQAADAGYTITGTADAGMDGKKNFSCQFDKKGKLANLVPEGK